MDPQKINELKGILRRQRVFHRYTYLHYTLKIWELFILNTFYIPHQGDETLKNKLKYENQHAFYREL